MANKKAQEFFEKKKAEVQSKTKGKDSEKKGMNTSKMPEGLRKYHEGKKGK